MSFKIKYTYPNGEEEIDDDEYDDDDYDDID